jgi:hypothetical protein
MRQRVRFVGLIGSFGCIFLSGKFWSVRERRSDFGTVLGKDKRNGRSIISFVTSILAQGSDFALSRVIFRCCNSVLLVIVVSGLIVRRAVQELHAFGL